MRKALIEIASGKVVNVVILPEDWAGDTGQWQIPEGHKLQDAGSAHPGDVWDGRAFVRPVIVVAPPTVISYEAFQDRFTAAEFDAATEFVDQIDLTTGKPKRPRLKQAMGRAWSSGEINLLDPRTVAFMAALVAGNVFGGTATPEGLAAAEARAAAILDPEQVS